MKKHAQCVINIKSISFFYWEMVSCLYHFDLGEGADAEHVHGDANYHRRTWNPPSHHVRGGGTLRHCNARCGGPWHTRENRLDLQFNRMLNLRGSILLDVFFITYNYINICFFEYALLLFYFI